MQCSVVASTTGTTRPNRTQRSLKDLIVPKLDNLHFRSRLYKHLQACGLPQTEMLSISKKDRFAEGRNETIAQRHIAQRYRCAEAIQPSQPLVNTSHSCAQPLVQACGKLLTRPRATTTSKALSYTPSCRRNNRSTIARRCGCAEP